MPAVVATASRCRRRWAARRQLRSLLAAEHDDRGGRHRPERVDDLEQHAVERVGAAPQVARRQQAAPQRALGGGERRLHGAREQREPQHGPAARADDRDARDRGAVDRRRDGERHAMSAPVDQPSRRRAADAARDRVDADQHAGARERAALGVHEQQQRERHAGVLEAAQRAGADESHHVRLAQQARVDLHRHFACSCR
jgi:hypothetical protein